MKSADAELGGSEQVLGGYLEHLKIALNEALERRKRGSLLASGQVFGRATPLCYPGLRSFAPDEGSMFFGRDASLKDVQDRLGANRTLVVLGGSGSGKSSLIRAGILPFLNSKRPIRNRSGIWFWVEFRPKMKPLDELVAGLRRVLAEQVEDIEDGDDLALGLKQQAEAIVAGFASAGASAGDRFARATLLSDRLLEFTRILDEFDTAKYGKLRAAPVNLMLLIDQFEEVFRPEVDSQVREELLDFLVVTHGRIERAATNSPGAGPGLFIVVTMRSEELHRCAEHVPLPEEIGRGASRSLTDLVNKSFYLLRLLDPIEDRDYLRQAILGPVRGVLKAYQIPTLEGDYPYEPGVIDWLLAGTTEIGLGTDHQPDQMPLLQHALRQMWLNAVTEWPTTCSDEATPPMIGKRHLFATFDSGMEAKADADAATASAVADLRGCLQRTADWTAGRASLAAVPDELAGNSDTVSPAIMDTARLALRQAVLKAIFRALARRDDRNNWARRFGSVTDMDDFLACDPNAAHLNEEKPRKKAIRAALEMFAAEGLVQDSTVSAQRRAAAADDEQYDISHEALIRNWTTCQAWLAPLDVVTGALKRAVDDMTPAKQRAAREPGKGYDWLVPQRMADDLAPLEGSITADHERLPPQWAWDEIVPMLAGAEARRAWSIGKRDKPPEKEDAKVVLGAILKVRGEAESERRKARDHAEREQQKRATLWNTLLGIGVAALLCITAIGTMLVASNHQRDQATADKIKASQAANAAALLSHATQLYPVPGEAPKFAEAAMELAYASDLLARNGTDSVPPEKILPLVQKTWDQTARIVFGAFLLDAGSVMGLSERKNHAARCLVVGAGGTAGGVTLALPDKSHTVRMAVMQGAPASHDGDKVGLAVDGADNNSATDNPSVGFTLDVFNGDRVCISDDGQMLAWVRALTPDSVTLGEVAWLWRNKALVPYVQQVSQIYGNKSSSGPQDGNDHPKSLCVRNFFTVLGKVGTVQGVEFEELELPRNTGSNGTILPLDCPADTKATSGALVHFEGISSFSPLVGDLNLDDARKCQPSDADAWKCDSETIKFSKQTIGQPFLTAAILDKDQNPRVEIPVPMVNGKEVKQVYLKDGRLVLETDGQLRFMLIASGKHILEMLSEIDSSGEQTPLGLCKGDVLPGCVEWVEQHRHK